MRKITDFHHMVSEFYKVNITLLFFLFLLIIAGAHFRPSLSLCDTMQCFTPKVEEEESLLGGLEFQQTFGDKHPLITSAQLSSLADKTISTGEGRTKYTQYLRFKGNGRDPIESGSTFFGRDRSGKVDDFLRFNAQDDIYEYGVVFEEGLQSTIKDKRLVNLVNEPITMVGQTVYIIDGKIDTDAKTVTLRFLDTLFVDSLGEGQRRVYRLGEDVFDIRVSIIDEDQRVTFVVNDHETKTIIPGQMVIFPDETVLGVAEVMLNEAGEGKDVVLFYFSRNAFTVTDKYSDTEFSANVQSQREPLHTAKAAVIGSLDGNTFQLSALKFRLVASSGDVYIPAGQSLRGQLLEPDAMFPTNWDIVYNGFHGKKREGTIPVEFDPTGDGFMLLFTSREGVEYRIPLLSGAADFSYGDGRRTLHYVEAASSTTYTIAKNDLFVATSQNNDQGTTHILSYEGIDTATRRLFFRDWAVGQKDIPYEVTGVDGQEGKAILNIAGQQYPVFISSASGNALAVDLTGDGSVSGSEANIILTGGGRLDLGTTNDLGGSSSVTMRLIVPQRLLKEATADEVTQIVFTKSGNTIDVDVPNQGDLRLTASPDRDALQGQTKFGTLFQLNRRKATGQLFIDFPKKQLTSSVTIKVKKRMEH